MKVKHILPMAMATAVATSQSFAEEAEKQPGWWLPGAFSGYATVTNNYDYRGITYSDDDPAIQGSLNYGLDTGYAGTSIYAGVRGTNVEFNDGDRAHVELDWSFGLSGQVLDSGLGWSLGGIYYQFPGAGDYNFWEVASALTYPIGLVTLRAAINYSPDFFNGSGEEWYPHGGFRVSIPIPDNWFTLAFDAYTGYMWIEDNDRFGAADYQDWKIGFVLGIKNVALSAYYTDTDLTKNQCRNTGDCGARAVLAATVFF